MTTTYPMSAVHWSSVRTLTPAHDESDERPSVVIRYGSTDAVPAPTLSPPMQTLYDRAQEIMHRLDDPDDQSAFLQDLATTTHEDLDFLIYEWEETVEFDQGSPNAVIEITRAIERRSRT